MHGEREEALAEPHDCRNVYHHMALIMTGQQASCPRKNDIMIHFQLRLRKHGACPKRMDSIVRLLQPLEGHWLGQWDSGRELKERCARNGFPDCCLWFE